MRILPFDCSTIVFADANLEAAVRHQIDTLGVITPSDVANMTYLDARGYGVGVLDGIECFSELSDIDFGIGGQTAKSLWR